MKAQDFWTQTPLNAINKLMDQTFSYAQEADSDLAEMYMDDLRDFKKAVSLFRNSDNEELGNLIDYMDTEPREQLIIAFAEDCGKDFVSQNLGWELA
jgi:hypothetical protein